MNKEDTKNLVLHMYDAVNTRNWAALDEIWAPNFYHHTLKTGIEGSKESYVVRIQALPDLQVVVEELLVDEEKAASRISIHGVPAIADGTQPVIIEMFRIQNQRIAEIWAANMG